MPKKKAKQAVAHALAPQASTQALETMIEIMRDPQGKPADRLRAADMILEQAGAQQDAPQEEMELDEALRRLQALGLEVREAKDDA